MKLLSKERNTLYATEGDFCRIFREDMKSLYLLSLVLTADPVKAEQCFVAGLDDCATGNQVFKEWARSWARRVVIKNAIRTIAPEVPQIGQDSDANPSDLALPALPAQELPAELAALFRLPAFERFAFVLSACEGYADRDCALLLGCSRQSLISARTRALQRIRNSEAARNELRTQDILISESDRQNSMELAVSSRLAVSA